MADSSDTDEHRPSAELEVEWAEEELGRFQRLKHWTIKEAKYLLTGLDPWAERYLLPGEDPYVYLPHGRDPEHQESDPEARSQNIEANLEFTERYIAAAGIAEPRAPREFLALAAENGHRVPWIEFARSSPKLRQFLPEHEDDQAKVIEELRDTVAKLTAALDQLRREHEALQPLSGKPQTTTFKMIGGMAKGAYQCDLRKPQAQAIRRLMDHLDHAGGSLSENTVRSYLRKAADYLERPENSDE